MASLNTPPVRKAEARTNRVKMMIIAFFMCVYLSAVEVEGLSELFVCQGRDLLDETANL